VRVFDGFVTLVGTVDWHCEREAAEARTADVPGVVGIANAIALTQTPDADGAREAIIGAFQRNALLDADALLVETSSGGLVTVSGTVSSWAAHDQAVSAAWFAAGVTQVDDRIQIGTSAPPRDGC
jgi:osmotically-inducible protein OsmY